MYYFVIYLLALSTLDMDMLKFISGKMVKKNKQFDKKTF